MGAVAMAGLSGILVGLAIGLMAAGTRAAPARREGEREGPGWWLGDTGYWVSYEGHGGIGRPYWGHRPDGTLIAGDDGRGYGTLGEAARAVEAEALAELGPVRGLNRPERGGAW